MKKIILSIDGMTCSACSNGLEKYLNKQKGITNASVNLVMKNATIEYDEKLLNIDDIEKFVKESGFKSLGLYDIKKEKKNNNQNKFTFLFFLILAIILMYISMGHMVGLPIVDALNMQISPINYTVTLFILSLLFIGYGLDIIISGIKNLLHKTPNMDTLVSIGVISSMLYSIYSMYMVFNGNHSYVEQLYFESAAIVIFFIKLGRYIDSISKDKTKEAIQQLVQITPNDAIIKVKGKEKKVTLDEIKKGDIVISRPGDKIAVDGEIVSGKSHVDESFITGESRPVAKTIGNKVIAGSINYDGYLEYKAVKIGKESTISEIVRLVIEATNTKAPIAKIVDKVSGYFVSIVILIAIVTFLIYVILGYNVGNSINVFVTILVVACPCSLGLATPLAIIVSEGICATNGILVKKSEVLENASKTNVVVFDKTGTLTYGSLQISKIINYSKMKDENILQIVGSFESKSTHPVAKPFIEYLNDHKIKVLEVDEFKNISGYGIVGKIENKDIILGNEKILTKYKIKNDYKDDEEKISSMGNSIVYVVINKKIVAIIGINDIIKDNAKDVITNLNKRGIKTIMLTGDNSKTATQIANNLGIKEVKANMLPKDKANFIKDLKQNHNIVIMCGDGINDSVALANSDIGISVNSGTDIAMDSSSVILTNNNLNSIINLINISTKTIKNIKQNLFWAFFYNSLMIPIAIGLFAPLGITINPMIASFAMVISSFTVILNALRLRRIKIS